MPQFTDAPDVGRPSVDPTPVPCEDAGMGSSRPQGQSRGAEKFPEILWTPFPLSPVDHPPCHLYLLSLACYSPCFTFYVPFVFFFFPFFQPFPFRFLMAFSPSLAPFLFLPSSSSPLSSPFVLTLLPSPSSSHKQLLNTTCCRPTAQAPGHKMNKRQMPSPRSSM